MTARNWGWEQRSASVPINFMHAALVDCWNSPATSILSMETDTFAESENRRPLSSRTAVSERRVADSGRCYAGCDDPDRVAAFAAGGGPVVGTPSPGAGAAR